MKTLNTLVLVPMLAAIGLAAPLAYGDDNVQVRASIIFDINGGTFGFRPPVRERVVVVEQPVVQVYEVERERHYCPERPRPVVYIYNDHRCSAPVVERGRKLGHYKHQDKHRARTVIVRERSNDRNDRHDARPVVVRERSSDRNDRSVQRVGKNVREAVYIERDQKEKRR